MNIKLILTGILILALVLGACAPAPTAPSQSAATEASAEKSKDPMKGEMANMPCHQMPDGTWMGKDCTEEQKNAKAQTKELSLKVLRAAPEFSATTTEGKKVSLESYKKSGKPTVVYFTSATCSTCAKNWPSLDKMYKQHGKDVNIVAIGIDPTDSKEVLTKLAADKGLTYPMVAGNPKIMLDFGVTKQASTIGINSNGDIVFANEKEHLTEAQYEDLFAQLKADSTATKSAGTVTKTKSSTLPVLRTAPDFSATTITGKKVSLDSYKASGKPTVVYFTASWCSTCAKNWPSLEKVHKEFKDKVNVVAISIDPTDTDDVLTKLAKDKSLTYPMVAGNPDIMLAFEVSKQASTIGINKEGDIVFFKEKAHLTESEYRDLFEQLQQ